jgi:6-phosphogluconolactonase
MNRFRFGLSVILASACTLLTAGAASAASGVVGHVYVNDNTAGVNTIGGFDRHSDGRLTPMPGSPFVAGGVGSGSGFKLNRGGHLRPLVGSTVTLPDASQPGDVLFSPDGRKLVGTRVATSLIDSFSVDRDGRLSAAPGSPFAAQGLGPFGSEFRPHERSAALCL